MQAQALKWLQREMHRAEMALYNAEKKPGVKQEQLDDINKNISVLEWLIRQTLGGDGS